MPCAIRLFPITQLVFHGLTWRPYSHAYKNSPELGSDSGSDSAAAALASASTAVDGGAGFGIFGFGFDGGSAMGGALGSFSDKGEPALSLAGWGRAELEVFALVGHLIPIVDVTFFFPFSFLRARISAPCVQL